MAKSNFNKSLALILKWEGGFVNHPADPGGATNLGVTLATARRLGIDVDGDKDTDIADIRSLKPSHAAKVYRYSYWDTVRGDDLPAGVDYATFDFSVNSGVSRATKFLQKVVGVTADGVIGPITLDAVFAMSPNAVITTICDARLKWLTGLKTWKVFGKGWGNRVKDVKKNALAMIGDKT